MDEFVKALLDEGRMIIENAPQVAIACAVIAAILIWLILHFVYRQRINTKDDRIEYLREQLHTTRHQLGEIQRDDPSSKKLNGSTKLELFFSGEGALPTLGIQQNISNWYALKNFLQTTNKETGETKETIIWNVFLVFDRPVDLGFVNVTFSTKEFPRFEVKDRSNRHAVLTIGGEMPTGKLTIDIETN